MKLPENLIKKIEFKIGDVICGMLPIGSDIKHMCIIIKTPCNENDLIPYFYMTSEKDKALKRLLKDSKAITFIPNDELIKYFPKERCKETVIQCDKSHLNYINYNELILKLSKNEIKKYDPICKLILRNIKESILNSKSYSKLEKEYLTKQMV